MHTEPSEHASNPEIQYEKTDAVVRPLYQFLFWICVVTILTGVLAWFLLKGLTSWREGGSVRAPMADTQSSQQPPAPRLQLREVKDLRAFRAEESQILTTYGVVDQEKGLYRIPIEQAMKLTLERGLPVAGASPEPSPKAATR